MHTHVTAEKRQEPTLVGIITALETVFPDEATRPSLRCFNEWKARKYFPSVKIGKRVFLDPVQVRKALDKRFTIHAIGEGKP
jgi:hypothetical protein